MPRGEMGKVASEEVKTGGSEQNDTVQKTDSPRYQVLIIQDYRTCDMFILRHIETLL